MPADVAGGGSGGVRGNCGGTDSASVDGGIAVGASGGEVEGAVGAAGGEAMATAGTDIAREAGGTSAAAGDACCGGLLGETAVGSSGCGGVVGRAGGQAGAGAVTEAEVAVAADVSGGLTSAASKSGSSAYESSC